MSTAEIRDRIAEELDYELEAQNQRSLARIFKGHPFIVVPDVVSELSRERVLVSEFVRGAGFEELKEYPQAQRDRIGEIVFGSSSAASTGIASSRATLTRATSCC